MPTCVKILKTNLRHYDSFRRILTDLVISVTIVSTIFFRSLIGLLKFPNIISSLSPLTYKASVAFKIFSKNNKTIIEFGSRRI